jgi:hypothetical protein
MIDFLVPIVWDVMFCSTDIPGELNFHFKFMYQRGLEVMKTGDIDNLVLEEMMAMIMPWNMTDDGYALGEPDPSIFRTMDEIVAGNNLANKKWFIRR